MNNEGKYSLIGVESHIMSIISYTSNAMKESYYSPTEIEEYMHDALSGDYNHGLILSNNLINEMNGG